MSLKFLKSLTQSDFSIVNIKKNLNLEKIIIINSKSKINSLNLFILNKGLRQFINSIIFIVKNKGTLTVFTSKQSISFVEELFTFKYKSKINFKTCADKCDIKTHVTRPQIMLLINYEGFRYQNLQVFFNNRVYLISEINVANKFKREGVYKVYNNINSFKKLIFLSILLKKITNEKI